MKVEQDWKAHFIAILHGRLLPWKLAEFQRWVKNKANLEAKDTYSSRHHKNNAGGTTLADYFKEAVLSKEAVTVHLKKDSPRIPFSKSGVPYANFYLEGGWEDASILFDTTEFGCFSFVGQAGTVEMDGCKISCLFIAGNAKTRLVLRNCWIGKIHLENNCCRDLILINCRVLHWLYEDGGDKGKPVTDYVQFKGTWIARTPREGAGPVHHLRKLRAALIADHQTISAGLIHSAELSVERKGDRWSSQILSYLYELCFDYGNSILRPFVWLLLFLFAMGAVVYCWQPLVLASDTSRLAGWQEEVAASGPLKALVYPFLTVFNPLGIFTRPFLTPSTLGWQALLTLLSLCGTLFLAFTAIAIRRRFKLE